MDGIVDKVKELCFSVNVEGREGLHKDVIDKLKRMFVERGYRVYLEYPICFESRIRKSGETIQRQGNVDLVGLKNERTIAIEFDSGVHLKFKSIEKLFQTDADVCIGIVRGKENALEENIERIKKITKESGFSTQDFWLIILTEKIAHKV
jgi:hypothetical protein